MRLGAIGVLDCYYEREAAPLSKKYLDVLMSSLSGHAGKTCLLCERTKTRFLEANPASAAGRLLYVDMATANRSPPVDAPATGTYRE